MHSHLALSIVLVSCAAASSQRGLIQTAGPVQIVERTGNYEVLFGAPAFWNDKPLPSKIVIPSSEFRTFVSQIQAGGPVDIVKTSK